MKNSDRFLDAYNKIDKRLRQLTGQGKGTSFSVVVDRAGNQEHTIRRYKDDLKQFGDLRNAIVHTRAGDRVIAEPNDRAVEAMERIAKLLLDPPRVGGLFQRSVFRLKSSEPIGNAVRVMLERSYSQIPICDGNQFVGLLTTNTVGRWLGSCVEEEIFSLEETRIADVLQYTEDENNCQFLAKRATLFEALGKFDSHEERGTRLEAILITEHGKPSQSLLGIITIWDLPRIHQELTV